MITVFGHFDEAIGGGSEDCVITSVGASGKGEGGFATYTRCGSLQQSGVYVGPGEMIDIGCVVDGSVIIGANMFIQTFGSCEFAPPR